MLLFYSTIQTQTDDIQLLVKKQERHSDIIVGSYQTTWEAATSSAKVQGPLLSTYFKFNPIMDK